MVVLAHKRSSATMRQGDSLVSEQKQCGVNATTEIWSAVTYHRFPESFRGLSPKQAASNGPEKTWDAFWPSTATSRLPKAVTSHRTPNLCRSLAHFAKCAACRSDGGAGAQAFLRHDAPRGQFSFRTKTVRRKRNHRDLECGDLSSLSRKLSGLVAKAGRVQRPGENVGRLLAFDGDKSPAKSGDKSPHSKSLPFAGTLCKVCRVREVSSLEYSAPQHD